MAVAARSSSRASSQRCCSKSSWARSTLRSASFQSLLSIACPTLRTPRAAIQEAGGRIARRKSEKTPFRLKYGALCGRYKLRYSAERGELRHFFVSRENNHFQLRCGWQREVGSGVQDGLSGTCSDGGLGTAARCWPPGTGCAGER